MVVVRQHRHPERAWTLELPGGIIDANEGVSEAGIREGAEESGIQLSPDSKITLMPVYRPNVGCSAEFVATVRVTNVEPLPQSEAQKAICERVLLSPEEFVQAIARGEIHDGHSLACFAYAVAASNQKLVF